MQTLEKELSKKDKFLQPIKAELASDAAFVPASVREEALKSIGMLDFPTRKTEAYKYTRVNKILNSSFKKGSAEEDVNLLDLHIPSIDAHNVVFVNGFFRADMSDIGFMPEGITCTSLREMDSEKLNSVYGLVSDHESEIFSALNTAFPTDGVFIHAASKAQSDKPIHVIHVTTQDGIISQPRHIIHAEKNSLVEVVQSFISQGDLKSFVNSLTEVKIDANAEVRLDKVQSISENDHHLSTECVKQGKDSRFSINSMQLHGGWIRNNLNIEVGEHCSTHLYGVYMPNDKEHVDNHTVVDHTMPHSESNELYKGIINDRATGVFNGKVFVRQDAQLTNAFQSNGNILMSDDATINSKPELEIYADDVKCSHGSTTGQFDEEALYYLRTRGLSEQSSRKLLVSAFLSEALANIKNDALRVFVEEAFEVKNS